MAGKLIIDLQQREEVSDNCNFAIDDSLQTYRVNAPQLVSYLNSKGIPSLYVGTKTYSTNDICIYEGKIYVSLIDSNTGNQPDTSAESWEIASGSGGEGDGLPVGTSIAFNGDTAPVNYIEENGAEIQESLYPQLYTAIGNKYVPKICDDPRGTYYNNVAEGSEIQILNAGKLLNFEVNLQSAYTDGTSEAHIIPYSGSGNWDIANSIYSKTIAVGTALNPTPIGTIKIDVSADNWDLAVGKYILAIKYVTGYPHAMLGSGSGESGHSNENISWVGRRKNDGTAGTNIYYFFNVQFKKTGYFNVDDKRGLFLRGIGENGEAYFAKADGTPFAGEEKQNDQFQNITGSVLTNSATPGTVSGVFSSGAAGSSIRPNNGTAARNYMEFNASLSTAEGGARTGDETRPANKGVLFCIKYQYGAMGEQGPTGPAGDAGASIGLEYNWIGTELGIKREDEIDYVYTDLEGPQGPQGIQGIQGEQGPAGADGADGVDGIDGEGVPVGFLGEVPTENPPSGWLARDGSIISKTTYANLYAVLKNIFWAGDFVANTEVPQMTSHTAPSGVVSHSSEYSTTYYSWKAFNKTNSSATDCWISGNGNAMPQWIQYQFTSAKTITNYAIENRNSPVTGCPVSWKFQGSNDGSTWDDLHEVSGNTRIKQSDRHSYGIENPASYIYYRLYITESSYASWTCVAQLLLIDASSETDFYLPDHRGLYARNIGSSGVLNKANGNPFVGAPLNAHQHDQFQNIIGSFTRGSSSVGVVAGQAGTNAAAAGALSIAKWSSAIINTGNGFGSYNVTFNAANSTTEGGARAGDETRVANYGVLPIIKY